MDRKYKIIIELLNALSDAYDYLEELPAYPEELKDRIEDALALVTEEFCGGEIK